MPVYGYTVIYLFVLSRTDFSVVSGLGPRQTGQQWAFISGQMNMCVTDLEVKCCITGWAHLQHYPTSVHNDRLRSQHNQEVHLFLWGTQRWVAGIPLPEILSAQLSHFGVGPT